MNNIERRDRELAYIADAAVADEMLRCRRILQKLNFMDRSDSDGIAAVVKELLGASDGAVINPPFYCDYGSHIRVGKNFFANYNCTIIDVATVTIGDFCQMAPNVAIYTAGHPVYPATRNSAYEYGKAVTIGDNVRTIGTGAFAGNKKLTKVTIGRGAAKIGGSAFLGDENLKTIVVKSTKLKSVGKKAIRGICMDAVIRVPKKQLKKYRKLFSPKTGFKKTMTVHK